MAPKLNTLTFDTSTFLRGSGLFNTQSGGCCNLGQTCFCVKETFCFSLPQALKCAASGGIQLRYAISNADRFSGAATRKNGVSFVRGLRCCCRCFGGLLGQLPVSTDAESTDAESSVCDGLLMASRHISAGIAVPVNCLSDAAHLVYEEPRRLLLI